MTIVSLLKGSTFAAVVDILTLGAGEQSHGIAAEILIEGTVHTGLDSLHAGKPSHESRRTKAIVVLTKLYQFS